MFARLLLIAVLLAANSVSVIGAKSVCQYRVY